VNYDQMVHEIRLKSQSMSCLSYTATEVNTIDESHLCTAPVTLLRG